MNGFVFGYVTPRVRVWISWSMKNASLAELFPPLPLPLLPPRHHPSLSPSPSLIPADPFQPPFPSTLLLCLLLRRLHLLPLLPSFPMVLALVLWVCFADYEISFEVFPGLACFEGCECSSVVFLAPSLRNVFAVGLSLESPAWFP